MGEAEKMQRGVGGRLHVYLSMCAWAKGGFKGGAEQEGVKRNKQKPRMRQHGEEGID